MAEQYRQLDSDLWAPDWMPDLRDRRRATSDRRFIFAPGGGAAPGCHCATIYDCPNTANLRTKSYGGEVELDLGAGGWTNAACSRCTELHSLFILGPLAAWDVFATNCSWSYCSPNRSCNSWCGSASLDMTVNVSSAGASPPSWRIYAEVSLSDGSSDSAAIWQSGIFLTADYPNFTDAFASGPVPLAKIYDGSYGGTPPCGAGGMPATVYLDLA